jgi:hypothetical protein
MVMMGGSQLTVPMGKANGEGGLERQPDHCPAPSVEEAQDLAW